MYIYGAGYLGARALEEYKKVAANALNFSGFIDTYKVGGYCGYPIVGIDEIENDEDVVIAVTNPYITCDIYRALRDRGVKNIYWYKEHGYLFPGNKTFYDSCYDCREWGNYVLPHGEIHITDKCNLNCKGCMHFSPLYFSNNDYSQTSVTNCLDTIKAVLNKVGSIAHFSILGGEPLLLENVTEYMTEIRKLLPECEINLTTNGLLIPKMGKSFFDCVRDNKIVIGISGYNSTERIKESIITVLKNENVIYNYQKVGDSFRRGLAIDKNGKYEAHSCISDGCTHLRDGKIARCPMLMYVSKINEVFNTQFPTDGIYTIADIPDGKILLDLMKQRVDLCDFCIDCWKDWDICDVNSMELEDFVLVGD